MLCICLFGLPKWCIGLKKKNLPANTGVAREVGSVPGLRSYPGVGNGNSLQCSGLEKFRRQTTLVGYGPWGREESDMTVELSTHTQGTRICLLWGVFGEKTFQHLLVVRNHHRPFSCGFQLWTPQQDASFLVPGECTISLILSFCHMHLWNLLFGNHKKEFHFITVQINKI